jgi:predicted choloylglycine hydrolase
MNSLRNDYDTTGNSAVVELNYERRDVRCRDIVDHAIAVQQSRNTMSAVEYLKSHDIAADVIERVMLDPQRRRRNCTE